MSVWVEIKTSRGSERSKSSRSTWACELKSLSGRIYISLIRHAPHERVSWNYYQNCFWSFYLVTLHMSVWVEIADTITRFFKIVSRSTWACELKLCCLHLWLSQRESRSTWACELKLHSECGKPLGFESRSTWACELKWRSSLQKQHAPRHAPHERVSWNVAYTWHTGYSQVTLHMSVWVEMPW